MRPDRALLAIVLGLPAACTFQEYEARPLVPQLAVDEFMVRSLLSDDFASFARNNLPADQVFPPVTWDLDTLTLAALFFHREMDIARAGLAHAQAGELVAAARPNPKLALDTEVVSGAHKPWVLGFDLGLPIETANKRGLRIERAEQHTLAAESDLLATAWNVRAHLREALVTLTSARAELHAREEELRARDLQVELLEHQLAAGRISNLEFVPAEQERQQLALALEDSRTREQHALALLAQALGLPRAALDGVAIADELRATLPETPESLAARDLGLQNRLDLRRSLVEYAEAEAALALEIARQWPDLGIAPGTSWDQGDHKYALGFWLELPLFHHNEGPIAAAQAARELVAARVLALQDAAIGAIESARVNYAGSLRVRTTAALVLLQARQLEERLERAVEAGAVDRAELLQARITRCRLAREEALSEERALQALGALENELQVPLVGRSQPGPSALQQPERSAT